MIRLAMYKGKGKIGNALIRAWTNSQYSHCELVNSRGICYSSSIMDAGVRKKQIEMSTDSWDFIDIPWITDEDLDEYFEKTDHHKYAFFGLLSSQFLNLGIPSKNAKFCSEWCAECIKIPTPSIYNPASLAKIAIHLRDIYSEVRNVGN